MLVVMPRVGRGKHTVKCQGNELQAHISKSNIQTSSQSARPNACEIKGSCHEWLLRLLQMLQLICIRDVGIMRIREGVVPWAEAWEKEENEGC